MVPITITTDAAPEQLLHIIKCKCTTSCIIPGYSCKKAGLLCSEICKHCVGTACENSPLSDNNQDDIDDESKDPTDLPPPPATNAHKENESIVHDKDDDDVKDNNDDVEGPKAPKSFKIYEP